MIFQLLEQLGLPQQCLVLDFETYYDPTFTLKDLPIPAYVADKRFEVLGVATKLVSPDFNHPSEFTWGEDCMDEVLKLDHDNTLFIVKNLHFEDSIFKQRYGFTPPHLIDLEDLHRHFHAQAGHKLKEIAEEFDFPDKGDTSSFIYWTNRLRHRIWRKRPKPCPKFSDDPAKAREMEEYACRDADITWLGFQHLLPRLTNPEFELRLMNQARSMFVRRPILRIDHPAGEQLMRDMQERLDSIISLTPLSPRELRATKGFQIYLTKVMEAKGYKPPLKMGKTGNPILALAKTDPEQAEMLNHPDETVRNLVVAKLAERSWPKDILRVKKMLLHTEPFGEGLAIPLKYHGAHTGRWSGSGSINLQNLAAHSAEPLHNVTRTLIRPYPGNKIVVCDASQIECRILAWLAGQEDLLDKFRAGVDPYCDFATQLLKQTVDPSMKRERTQGKVGVLGCLAEGTPVVTETRGLIPIEEITVQDKVWDGLSWVSHEGAVPQGKKECIYTNGIWMTPDHEVYAKGGWYQAQDLSTNNPESEPCMATSWLDLLSLGLEGGSSPSNVYAPVVESLLRAEIIWSRENQRDVMCVLKRHLLRRIQNTDSSPNPIVLDFLGGFLRSLAGAITDHTPDTENGESSFMLSGTMIEWHFFDTLSRWPDGMTGLLKSIGSTIIGDTNPVIYDSPQDRRTCETWDIIRAGSNRRFQAGKLMVANCGYGMGPDACQRTSKTIYGLDLSDREAKKIVGLYRTSMDKIVQFWADLERAMRCMVKAGKDSRQVGRLLFEREGDLITIKLPSGRKLYYHGMRIRSGGLCYKHPKKNHEVNVYGGFLAENVTQAVARDVLAVNILACEDAGIEIAFTIHDELITAARLPQAQRTLDRMIEIMSTCPEWLPNCPLGAEGQTGYFYAK